MDLELEGKVALVTGAGRAYLNLGCFPARRENPRLPSGAGNIGLITDLPAYPAIGTS